MCKSTDAKCSKEGNHNMRKAGNSTINSGSSRRRRGKRDRHALKSEPKVILHALDTEFKIESLFPIMGVIFVGVLAVMARAGFRGRLSVAGIDLGTTNSVVCVQALSSSVGEIECINDPGTGSPLIPSVVSFLLDKDHKKQFSMLNIDKEKEIDVLVGYDAKQRIDSHAHSTIFHSKRFLGRDFSDEAVTEQQAEVEFDVALDIHNTAISPSSLDGAEGGGVVFRIPHIGGDFKADPVLGKKISGIIFPLLSCCCNLLLLKNDFCNRLNHSISRIYRLLHRQLSNEINSASSSLRQRKKCCNCGSSKIRYGATTGDSTSIQAGRHQGCSSVGRACSGSFGVRFT